MFIDLPPEILAQIISYSPTARVLRNLELTCRTLNEVVKSEGWKTFTLTQFPSFSTPSQWKDAAHALTTLSRNFDRRALLARNFPPNAHPIHTLPDCKIKDRWYGPQGQTMGYQPVLDSYEEWTGRTWGDRKEVVAWGAGAELVVKIVDWGGQILDGKDENLKPRTTPRFGNTRTKYEWLTYRESQHTEGRDDITTLKLLRPNQRPGLPSVHGCEYAVVGRASGELKLLSLSKGVSNCVVRDYETRRAAIRSADITAGSSPQLLACLGDSRAAIYSINGDERIANPTSEVSCVGEAERICRTWATKFLSENTVAIGRGVTKNPVHVYHISPDGINKEPIRVFGSGKGRSEGPATSVYSIVKIPSSSGLHGSEGQEFFSGGYDGKIRLHDMRSPSNCEAVVEDPTEFSAIFSLLMVGRERLLAGGAANSLLKVFDLRMIGGRNYSYVDLAGQQSAPAAAKRENASDVESRDPIYASGWNLFTSPSRQNNANWRSNRRAGESPLYSLSSPSPCSPNIYAGIENNVVHLNFTSMMDEHPDPLFRKSMRGSKANGFMIGQTWDPVKKGLILSMYDQNATGDLPLRMQRPVGPVSPSDETLKGYDERWCDPSTYHSFSRWPRNRT